MESLFADAAKQNELPQSKQSTPTPTDSARTGGMQQMFQEAAAQQAATQAPQELSPRQSGEIVNDVGNKVIVPKDGESFADTMKRAAAHGKNVTQQEFDNEVATMPGKAVTVLAAAPVIGAAGTAGGAAVNEVATALPSVIPHTIAGVKAVGEWAKANPIQAYLLYNVLKELIPGAKKAMGVIKGTPEVE